MGFFQNDSHPIAENIARTGFYVPSGLGLSEDDITYVCNCLIEFDQSI